MSRKLIYIASPYAGDVEKNLAFAIRCCRFAIQQGETPIAPHILYPQMLNDSDPQERALGLSLGHQLLEACNELWVCGDRISQGMEGEIAAAKRLGLPLRYICEAQIEDTTMTGLSGTLDNTSCVKNADRPGGDNEPESADLDCQLDLKTELEIGGKKYPRSQLATKAEVLDQLSQAGASFAALEPIRERYMELHGNDLCWSYPVYMYNHLGCVLMPVQEGILYLPYNSLDHETYEQFDPECAKLLTVGTAQKIKESLLSQVSELHAVLIDVSRGLGSEEDCANLTK